MKIENTIIPSSTGIPQCSVFRPSTLSPLLQSSTRKSKADLPNINIQASVDNIIILARTKEKIQKALDNTYQEIKYLSLALNLKKYEYVIITKQPLIDPHT